MSPLQVLCLLHTVLIHLNTQQLRYKYFMIHSCVSQAQCRRVYEILKLRSIDRSNSEQYYNYRVFVKNRLNGTYQVGGRSRVCLCVCVIILLCTV